MERLETQRPRLFFRRAAKRGGHSPSAMLRQDKNTAKPRREVFPAFQIMNAQGGGAEHPAISVSDPADGQGVLVRMVLELEDTAFDGFFRQHGPPMCNDGGRQNRNELRVICKIADLHCLRCSLPPNDPNIGYLMVGKASAAKPDRTDLLAGVILSTSVFPQRQNKNAENGPGATCDEHTNPNRMEIFS